MNEFRKYFSNMLESISMSERREKEKTERQILKNNSK